MSTAEKLTAERGAVYGHPLDDFTRAAAIKYAIAEMTDDVLRHALEMVAVKMARLVNTPDHLDSWDDIAGYALCGRKIIEERKRRAPPFEGVIVGDINRDPSPIWKSPDGMTPPAPPVMRGASVAVGPSQVWIAPEDAPSIAADLGSMPFAEAAQILTNRSSGDAP